MTPDRDTAFDPVRLPRRNLLRSTVWTGVSAVSLGLLTACDGPAPGSRSSPTPKPKPDPDLPLVTSAVALSRQLLLRYAATTARHPGLKEPLAAYVKRHQAHVAALSDGSAGPKPSPTPTPRPSPTVSATPTAAPVASSAGAAVRALVSLESSAAQERSKALVRARNPELARLLASVSACEALHALALAEVADG